MNNHNDIRLWAVVLQLACTLLAGAGLTGCGGGSGSGSAASFPDTQVEGVAGKGIMSHAVIRALDPATGEELARTRSAEDGTYRLQLNHQGPLLLAAETDADTLLSCDALTESGCGLHEPDAPEDLNRNGIIDFGERYRPGAGHFQLFSFLPQTSSGQPIQGSITPLTHTAWRMAQAGGDLSPGAVLALHERLNNLLGLRGNSLPPPADLTREIKDINPEQMAPETIAHGALIAAMATWAYTQPEGVQTALERLAQMLADRSLPGFSDEPGQPSLHGLMEDSIRALERAARLNPGWPTADLAGRFAIRSHLGRTLGPNPVILPLATLEHTATPADAIEKGRALIGDLRGWANGLMDEDQIRNQQYGERIRHLETLLAGLQAQQRLLLDLQALLGDRIGLLLGNSWHSLHSCLVTAADAMRLLQLPSLPSHCPSLILEPNRIRLTGAIRNASGQRVGQALDLTVQLAGGSLQTPAVSLTGRILDDASGLELHLQSVTWTLHPADPQAAPEIQPGSDFSLEGQISLNDRRILKWPNPFQGHWRLSQSATAEGPRLETRADGLFQLPNGTLSGVLSSLLSPPAAAAPEQPALGNLAFEGTLAAATGEHLTGQIQLHQGPLHATPERGTARLRFEGLLQSPGAVEFEGSLELAMASGGFYLARVQDWPWWGWMPVQSDEQGILEGLDNLSFRGQVASPSGNYRIILARLDIHDPENLPPLDTRLLDDTAAPTLLGFVRGLPMLKGSWERYPRYSATLVFEDLLSGRDTHWIALALDRFYYNRVWTDIRFTSHLGEDWRSLAVHHTTTSARFEPFKDLAVRGQQGADLNLRVPCSQPIEYLAERCRDQLWQTTGTLDADGETVARLQGLTDGLVKLSYRDGRFEMLP